MYIVNTTVFYLNAVLSHFLVIIIVVFLKTMTLSLRIITHNQNNNIFLVKKILIQVGNINVQRTPEWF